MTTTVTLLAPVGVHPVIASSGTIYTPDANNQVVITVPSPDVIDLLQQGCVPVANVANTVQAGSDGAAGIVTVFAGTASKGKVTIDTADNTGNTTTHVNFAAQAGARTLTVPDVGTTAGLVLAQSSTGIIKVLDASNHTGSTIVVATQSSPLAYTIPDVKATATFLLTHQVMGANGLFPAEIKILDARNANGTGLSATPATGNFTPSATFGTSLGLIGNSANNNTKTDTAYWEVILPPTYIAATNISVVVHALYTTAGTVGTKTLAALAYASAAAGTQGSNLVATSAATLTTADAAYTFTITGTTLSAGQRVILGLQTAIQETAAGGNIYATINSITLS